MRSDLSTYEFCCALDSSIAVSDADRQLGLALAYDPDQARADDGKWTDEGGGGGGGGGGKSKGGGGDKSKGKKVASKREERRDIDGYTKAEQRAAMAKGPELSKKLGQQVSVFANGRVFDDLGEHIGDYDGTNFKPKVENPIVADAERRANEQPLTAAQPKGKKDRAGDKSGGDGGGNSGKGGGKGKSEKRAKNKHFGSRSKARK